MNETKTPCCCMNYDMTIGMAADGTLCPTHATKSQKKRLKERLRRERKRQRGYWG